MKAKWSVFHHGKPLGRVCNHHVTYCTMNNLQVR